MNAWLADLRLRAPLVVAAGVAGLGWWASGIPWVAAMVLGAGILVFGLDLVPWALMRLGWYRPAARLSGSLAERFGRSRSGHAQRLNQVAALLASGRLEEAKHAVKELEADREDAQLPDEHRRLQWIHLSELAWQAGDGPTALSMIEAAEAVPGEPAPEIAAVLHGNRVQALYQMGRFAEGLERLGRLPVDRVPPRLLARWFGKLAWGSALGGGKPALALTWARQAERIGAAGDSARAVLGLAELVAGRDPVTALAKLETVPETGGNLDPQGRALLCLAAAEAHRRSGNPGGAERWEARAAVLPEATLAEVRGWLAAALAPERGAARSAA